MTIRRLRTLIAVADHATFSAAADAIRITHAAVSQQMQALEDDLGTQLFDRTRRTPQLTPFALQIVAKARNLVADYDNLVPSVLQDGGLGGVITLGVLRTTLTGLVPQSMANLKAKYPDLGLHIRPGLTANLLADIERGNLDAAIVTRPYALPLNVVFRELAVEPMHLITALEEPEDNPLVLLKERQFIRFDRTAVVGALIDNWITEHRIQVKETMELDSPEAITSMVRENLGVSIVPDMAVKPDETTPVKYIPLGQDAPRRILGLVHHKNQPKTDAIDELYKALVTIIGQERCTIKGDAQ